MKMTQFKQVKISKILLGERECKVLLEVEKGEKFFVSEIEIKGNEVIPASRIREVISPKEGEIFVSKTLNNSLETLKDIYGERGYLYVWVKAETEKKKSEKTAKGKEKHKTKQKPKKSIKMQQEKKKSKSAETKEQAEKQKDKKNEK